MVQYRIIKPRLKETDGFEAPTSGRTGAPETVSATFVNKAWTEYTADPRNLYMGPTPSKNGPVGKLVQTRMTGEGKPVNGQVKYYRDATGTPDPPGKFDLYPISECAMGHVIDAVTWW